MGKNFFYIWLLLILCGCAVKEVSVQEKLYFAAPSQLPHTTREMKTAGFWIGRHPFPDRVMLSSEQIQTFNKQIQDELKLTTDLRQFADNASGEELKKTWAASLEEISKKGLYLNNGHRAGEGFFEQIKEQMNSEGIPLNIVVQFGFIVHYADQRILPTQEGLYEKQGDVDFDELQDNALDIATSVVILAESKDRKWLYGQSPSSAGWILSKDVAFCSREEFESYLALKDNGFIVTTSAKTDLYLDPQLREHYGFVQMGTRFPSQELDGEIVKVVFPLRQENGKLFLRAGFLKAEDAHAGSLPYTARVMIEQAFKLLDKSYGWGGMYGEQDCSRFLQQLFATVGLELPRNSSAQAKVGRVLAEFDKEDSPGNKTAMLKEKAVGGLTILPLKGHIMLFLGMVDERAYAVHALWAYREAAAGEDRVRVINRVAVTDLSLGEGSRKGSLIQRMNSIRIIAE